MAYPGTFVLDERGIIRDKHFEQSYRVRPTRSIILDWAASGAGSEGAEATATETLSAIELSAWTDEPTYRPYQQLRLHVRFTLPRDMHAYAAPVPPGYQALSVELEPMDGLEVGGLALGASRPFSVAGLDEPFMVYDGTIEATLSFMLIRNLGSTSLCVRVRYQACTELACLPPASISQQVVLEGLDLIRD